MIDKAKHVLFPVVLCSLCCSDMAKPEQPTTIQQLLPVFDAVQSAKVRIRISVPEQSMWHLPVEMKEYVLAFDAENDILLLRDTEGFGWLRENEFLRVCLAGRDSGPTAASDAGGEVRVSASAWEHGFFALKREAHALLWFGGQLASNGSDDALESTQLERHAEFSQAEDGMRIVSEDWQATLTLGQDGFPAKASFEYLGTAELPASFECEFQEWEINAVVSDLMGEAFCEDNDRPEAFPNPGEPVISRRNS